MLWRRTRAKFRSRPGDAALAAILIGAAFARLNGIGFGLPHPLIRPDEEAIASVALRLFHGEPPRFFNYPALFMTAVALCLDVWLRAGAALGYLRDRAAVDALLNTTTLHMIARFLSAAAGVASVWVIYRIAYRVFDRATALASATFLALAFLHVRDSHFGVTDVPATFVGVLAFLAILRLSDPGRDGDVAAAATLCGFATATKYNMVLIALPAVVAMLRDPRGPTVRLRRLSIFTCVMALAFAIGAPYSVLDWTGFAAALREESAHLMAGHGVILGRGWVVHLTSTLRYGLGLPMLVAAAAGLLSLVRSRPGDATLVAIFPVAYFALLGSGYTVFARYMLPIVPFLCLTAGHAVTGAARGLAQRMHRPEQTPAATLAAVLIVVAPSAWSVIQFDRLISRTDNRLVAARWIRNEFPDGASIAQIGPEAGHVFTTSHDRRVFARYVTVASADDEPRPDLIVVQSSPLVRGAQDAPTDLLAREYVLRASLIVDAGDPANVYDWQDEFYVPLTGFRGIARPGPNLKIYVRRDLLGATARSRAGFVARSGDRRWLEPGTAGQIGSPRGGRLSASRSCGANGAGPALMSRVAAQG